MVPVLLLLPLVAVAQLCTCYDTDAQGHFQQDGICQTCGFTSGVNPVQYSGPQCKNLPLRVNWPSAAYYCNGVNDATICNNFVVAGTLIGGGTCANRTSCLCSGNRAGTYCERCSPGWAGYPACTIPSCNATSCNGNGACQDIIPCGLTACNPSTHTCQVDTIASTGQRFYNCRLLTTAPCPGLGGNAQHLGVGAPFTPPAVGCSSAAPFTYNPSVGPISVSWFCAGKLNEEAACCPADTSFCKGNLDISPITPGGNERATCCRKTQTCCKGICCNSNQVCKALPTPPGGWRFSAQYTCASSYLTNMSAIRVVVVPLFLLLAIIVATVIVFRVGAPVSLAAPGGILVFFCILVLFSPNWTYALLVLLGVYFALASSKAKSANKYLYAFLFLVIVFAILLGGLGLGVIWVGNDDPFFPALGSGNTFNPTGTIDSKGALTGFQVACAQYYNYFYEDPFTLRPYTTTDAASGQNYWGYCDQKWLAAQQFFYVCIIVFLLVLIAGVAYAYGNDEAPSAPAGKGDTL